MSHGWCCSVVDITACLVTRGDQAEQMARIRESLIFDRVIVWDNSREPDWKCAGRYMAAAMSETELVFFMDDDVLVPPSTQEALVTEYDGEECLAVYGHGENPDGYDDLPLVCGGAIVSKTAAWQAIRRYSEWFPLDTAFMYEADFVVGVLYRHWRHVHLPFEINLAIAQHESRLVNQPFQKALKLEITERARTVRDGHVLTAA